MSILFLFKLGNGITDRFFKCLSTVLVNFSFVLFTMCKTSCTADTTADTQPQLRISYAIYLKCFVTFNKIRFLAKKFTASIDR